MTSEADLLGLITELRARPHDEAVRQILADALDDFPPVPFQRSRIPEWLRLCWLREADRPFRRTTRQLRSTGNFAVMEDLKTFLALAIKPADLKRYCRCRFDADRIPHVATTGTGYLLGLEVWIGEVDGDREDARNAAAALSWPMKVSCTPAYTSQAFLPGGARFILLPPLVMPPSRRKRKPQQQPPG
jgi:hypothetical protein